MQQLNCATAVYEGQMAVLTTCYSFWAPHSPHFAMLAARLGTADCITQAHLPESSANGRYKRRNEMWTLSELLCISKSNQHHRGSSRLLLVEAGWGMRLGSI